VNKKVGDRIRKFRQLADLNQESVAEAIGMSGGNFGKIERGEIDINTESLQKLAKLFKVTVSEFFDEKPIHALTEKNINYGYASQTDLENLTEMVKQLAGQMEKLTELVSKKKKVKSVPATGKKIKPKK
jgi:transcriptional regulator with XRE-family HTH domain